jgi:hypothetical protein
MTSGETAVNKNYIVSDIVTRMAYFSIAAVVLVFLSLLALTTLHP